MINLYDILKVANGQLFGEPVAYLFTDFSLDAQAIGENQLFVALRTDRGDTHQYIEEAINNGASGVLCVDPPTCDTSNVSVLMVNNTVDALLAWAKYSLEKLEVKAIAVVGSYAKSATVDAIAHVLRNDCTVLAGNVDISGQLVIPLSLAQINADYDYAVFKCTPTFAGEMAQMLDVLQPHIVAVTNIDCVHLSAFDDCDQYTDEITLALKSLNTNGLAVLNYDDDRTRALTNQIDSDTTTKTVSINSFGADIIAFKVRVGIEQIGYDLRYGEERFIAQWSPILGRHHLYSLLIATQIADFVGVELENALRSLTELAPLAGRMVFFEGENGSVLIDDSFSASHASTVAALDWLQEVKHESQRIIFVLGDMENLGRNSRFAHRSIGQKASEIVDIIITQGVESALSGRAAIDNGKSIADVKTTYSTQDVISTLDDLNINSNDIILVKGGESSQLEYVVEAFLANPADKARLVRQHTEHQETLSQLRPSRVEIDAEALATNIQIIKDHIGDETTLMAVVKADGYGHGAVLTARTALVNGAEYIGVASIAEAVDLRDAGILAPILIMTYAPADTARQAHQLDLTLTVFDLEQAKLYDRVARTVTGKLKVHIKIDSGMGRLGIFPEDAIHMFRYLNTLTNLDVEGIYTHFSSADDNLAYTEDQIENFNHAIRPLRAAGINVKYIHASNSPATVRGIDSNFNMVRPGLILYGLQPSDEAPLYEGMRPVMSWKTSVLQVKTFPAGHSIGYGNTYVTRTEEKIAILPVGYADGLRRAPSTWEYVLINGQRAPIRGRISMEKTAVSVDHIEGIHAGSEVVLLGQQGDEEITAEMIAEWLGTINYEVVTSIIPRIPRR